MAPRATTFHRFTDFPMEIQLLIWKEAVMDDKRIVPVRRDCRAVFVTEELLRPPKFFLVCQASLTAARRFYNLRLRFRQPKGGAGIPATEHDERCLFDQELGCLYLDEQTQPT
ncbi:hypothetical protein PG993_003900 [Apiospora rasikravindrae]|uniref:2EXR domain-containing protein n=1 Tax=Apiospora rasikravindrae TaxID=990691 RepID=A0ABR1U0U9_9PEZI